MVVFVPIVFLWWEQCDEAIRVHAWHSHVAGHTFLPPGEAVAVKFGTDATGQLGRAYAFSMDQTIPAPPMTSLGSPNVYCAAGRPDVVIHWLDEG